MKLYAAPMGTKIRFTDRRVVPISVFEGEIIFACPRSYTMVEGKYMCECCKDLPKQTIEIHPGEEVEILS